MALGKVTNDLVLPSFNGLMIVGLLDLSAAFVTIDHDIHLQRQKD